MSDIEDEGLSAASHRYLERRDPGERKALGQYLTPRTLRESLLDQVPLRSGVRVLDPGVGTGEFLLSVRERCPDAHLVGWDVDQPALEVAQQLVPGATLENRSALDVETTEAFDLVIGNPPYFQLKLAPEQRTRFDPVISGRPNIFALFFQVGLGMLKPGGWLGYVVPPSMNNGAYFQSLRDYVTEVGGIDYLKVYEDARIFDGAQTAVQLIIVQKGAKSSKHVFDLQSVIGGPLHRTIFCEQPKELEAAFDGRSTLWDLGYRAVTGAVVWNQNRHRLRRDPDGGSVPLIWAHNLVEGEVALRPDHPTRPQYVLEDDPLRGPAIVANRVVGAVGSGSIRCGLVEGGDEFVGENHVNVIVLRDDVVPSVDWEELLELLQEPGVNKHVVRLTGNTQISATELTHMLPLATTQRVTASEGAYHSSRAAEQRPSLSRR